MALSNNRKIKTMFKNAMIYKVSERVLGGGTLADFNKKLLEQNFIECTQGQQSSFGFVDPVFGADAKAFYLKSGLILKAKRQEKIIQTSTVNDLVAKKVKEIEAAEGRFVSRKERQNLKEDIVHQLIPQAFDKNTYSMLYWDFERNLIIVNERAPSKAENLLGLLRYAMGSLPVRPVSIDTAPEVLFTDWVINSKAPANFELADKCKLESPQSDGGVIQCKREDLTRDEIIAHTKSGKQVTQLGLVWDEKVEFTIDSQLRISSIKLTDVVIDSMDDLVDPLPEDKFQADMEISTGLICRMHDDLMKAMS